MDNYGLLFSKSLGGGGGSGTDNYNELSNKPQINSVTLSGNKSLDALGIQVQLTFDTEPTEDSTNPVESGGVYSALASKQDTLTIDATPTENSSNPVQSGGTYTALAGKQDTLTFDDSPTSGSSNPVKSGGVYSALSDKQDTLTFEGTYNASSNKAATESTVSDAIKALDVAGASSIAASKTISAWSETDGKASISTQDIAIAGTQAILTGYTPESPSQTDSILATDTVNAAIKKLDERSRVDENNISWNTNQGVKNLSRWNSGTSTQAYPTMASQIPFTSDGGEYTISYNTALTTGTISVGFKDSNGNATVTVEIGNASKIKNLTIPANTAYFNIYTLAYGDYSNFMICPKSLYDADPSYQPYAMSNAELTDNVSIIDILSTVTTESGYTVTENRSWLRKQGKHVFGMILMQKSTAYSPTLGTAATMTYKPEKSVVLGTFLSSDGWGVSEVGYAFINPTTGAMSLKANSSYSGSDTYMMIPIDYMIS